MVDDFLLSGAIDTLRRVMPDGNEHLASKQSYYKSANADVLTWAAKVNIVLREYVGDKQRHQVLSVLVGRSIQSTKDLQVAEAAAIWNSRKNPTLGRFIRKVISSNE